MKTEIEIEGVTITLTKEQLAVIDKQRQKQKPVTERITNFQDVLDELGIDESNLPYKGSKSNLTVLEKQLNAAWKINKIAEVYNEGTVLDWENSNQYKYLPYKYWFGGSWSVGFGGWFAAAFSSVGLFFKSRDLAKDAYNKFKDIYEDYWGV
jgi:hypothetical protein